MYYILRGNDIAFHDTDLTRITDTVRLTQPDLKVEDIKETDREIIRLGDKFVFKDEHEQEYAEQQQLADDERALADLQAKIADLQAEMATAQLNGDAAWVSELQDQYNALINGGDE